MSGRRGRLAAVLAVGLLALVASLSAAGHISIDLPSVASSVDSELPIPRVAPGTMPTKVKPTAAKHGRTAPLVPAATLMALAALLLYGFGSAGAPAMLGRLARSASWSRSSRGPPARLSI
jgi:ABC-type Na+ efflux pump permease subunit